MSTEEKTAAASWPASLDNGSEMARRILARDWSRTPLGPITSWPQPLRTALGMCLSTRFPMFIYWGPERFQLYNDAGIPIMGARHPHAALAPVREVFPEIWHVIRPMFDDIERTGVATWSENQLLPLERNGFAEECYFTFSYSPIRDDSGAVLGFYTAAMETTGQVLGARRLRTLQAIAERAAGAPSVETACRLALSALGDDPSDVPFALLYLSDADGEHASLIGAAGIDASRSGAPEHVALHAGGENGAAWLGAVARTGQAQGVHGVADHLKALPEVPAGGVSDSALVLPLLHAEGERAVGFLVVGLSPRLALEGEYRGFLLLVASAVATAISSVRAQQEARERAEKLAALDRAKTAFFSNVSHEFRTPLTLMLGPVQDALADAEESLGPRQRARLVLLQRNTQRLLKLVNTLLDFSRLEAERAQAAFEPTDLAELTRELAGHFESAAGRAGLVLTVDAPALPEPVWVDREAWERVVFNLLSNALKFTFEGGITVSLRPEADGVALRVEDTGTGIPADALPHLFERFRRVEGARGRSHEGSGIGLALVQELVTLHGGTVSVQSTPGVGSTFHVHLPFGYAHLPPERLRSGDGRPQQGDSRARSEAYVQEAVGWLGKDAPAGEAPDASGLARMDGHVLVAEDNADLRAYLVGVLERHVSVEVVPDGLAALRAARARRPDLILSDVMMPTLGGFGMLRELRADPVLRAVPVILLSARAGEEASVEGLEAGADDYLVKPFSARELVARVRTHLEMVRVRREVSAAESREATLREAVRVRDEFLSVASHELKTPLASFQLQMDLLERSLGPGTLARVDERLVVARRQVQRLASVVETLLDVSQLTTGRLHLRQEPVDLAVLATEGVTRMREEAARAGCDMTVRTEASVPCHFDRVRLEAVVRDLLSNAVKFGAGRPIEVRVWGEAGLAHLSVVDHGGGVKPEDRERIWGRFERAVSARHYGGLGLGLWIARQVVEAHGGSIELTDTPGGGATFTARLPCSPAVEAGNR